MQVIVAVDEKWGIGKNNDLLFHLPEDLQYFKEKTLGKVIVMGGNTLLSFPGSKPLPKRTNIVLSDVFTRDDCIVVPTLELLAEELKKYKEEDIFIVGGAMFYDTMLPYCKEAYITKVSADGGASLFFPNLDEMENWEIIDNPPPTTSKGYEIRFLRYINHNPINFFK